MKNYFIIHGIRGLSNTLWTSQLKTELEKTDAEIFVPSFPANNEASIESWTKVFDEYKSKINEQSVFVCHSIGCLFAINFLANINQKICAAIFVSGFGDKSLNSDLTESHAEFLKKHIHPFLQSADTLKKFRQLTDKIFCIFSDNDHILPLKNLESFADSLNAKKLLLEGKGHFGNRANIEKIPEISDIIALL